MDQQGFETISHAFISGGVEATVTPEPAEGQNVRFITVETGADVKPASVLNVLHSARLLQRGVSRDMMMNYGPELLLVDVQPGSLTFEDTNNQR